MAEMETKASQPGTSNQSVQLGIGTLIIIALIVTMCSGRGEVETIQQETAELRRQLGVIDRKLDTLIAKDSAATSKNVEAFAAPADEEVEEPQNP